MLARAQILLAALLFGTTGTAQALAGLGAPLAVGTMRVAIGGAALLLLASRARALRGLGAYGRPLLACGAAVATYQLAFFAAVETTGVVVGTVVAIGVGPIATGALEWIARGRRPTARWLLATIAAAGGVLVLALAAGDEATVDPRGVALALVAGAGYATYTVIAKVLLERGCEPVGVMASAFALGALLLTPVLALGDLTWLATPQGWMLALYLGLAPTALAYLLFARGLRAMPAAEAATLTLAEPVTAALLGAFVLGEQLGLAAALGVALVALAMAILLVVRTPRAALVGAAA